MVNINGDHYFSRDDVRALRDPPPRVIAMLAQMIADGPGHIARTGYPAQVWLRMKWNDIIDELVR